MNVRHQMLLAAINRHGRYVERHRASKAQAAQRSNGAADYWREVVKFSAVNCRAWLSMARQQEVSAK